MLFNSHVFIFLFLPVALLGFFSLAKVSHRLAAGWIAAASLFFYGWWNPVYVLLLLLSVLFNYTAGIAIVRSEGTAKARRLLFIAIGADLGLLGYYKYFNFFLETVGPALGVPDSLGTIVLPLGISFFTFTQIAYLVDAYQGKAREYSLVHYGLFVTYFPHLIAGPILHHREMMPQFARPDTYRMNWDDLAAGLTIFIMGLFKKVIIADGIAGFVSPAFDASRSGIGPTFLEAWCGALAYTFQLYFDFSGYSDMAIGLSLMFGIRLPINFHSPYKALNVIEFWRRWHMTLSRFLRDYLYIPLGGNRKGPARRYASLMITMLLGGLWHGAGWTFVVWGGVHGLYLAANHAWRGLRRRLGQDIHTTSPWGAALGCLITFIAVVAGWAIFRAETLGSAGLMLKGMAGWHGIVLPEAWLYRWGAAGEWMAQNGVVFGATPALPRTGVINWIWILLLVVWWAPNTQQIMSAAAPALGLSGETHLRWRWRHSAFAALTAAGMAVAVLANLNRNSAFLYFQF